MPVFTVMLRVDAYVDYLTEVEADNAEEAAELAYVGRSDFEWKEGGVTEFDACLCVTLDDDGDEIPGTETGKLTNTW